MNDIVVMEAQSDSEYENPVSPGGEFRASFDLTSFGDAKTWQEAIDLFGFEEREVEYKMGHGSTNECFLWFNEKLTVRTYNNPRTGEHAGLQDRPNQKGYASYIHVVGEEMAVVGFYRWVKANASHIKEASLGEWVV